MELYKNSDWKEVTINNEIKKLPNDWEFSFVKDLGDVTSGGTPSTKEKSYWDKNEVKWLSSGEVNNSKIYNSEKYISLLGLKKSSAKLLPKESVLIALAGQGKTRGQVAITKVELSTNQSVGAILPSDKFNSDFLYFNLLGRYSELRVLSGGDNGRGGLNLQKIKKLDMFMPTISEQNDIVEVLSSQEKVIEKTKELIKNLDKRNQFMIDELLSGRLRIKEDTNGQIIFYKNKEWKTETINDEEIEVPKDWDSFEINKFLLEKGKSKITAKTGSERGKYPFFNCSNKQTLRVDNYLIDEEILYLSTGGKASILFCNEKSSYSTDVWAIKFNQNLSNQYIFYFFNNFLYLVDRCFKGAALKHLNKKDFKKIIIFVPKIIEQQKILKVITSLIYEKEKYEKILKQEEKKFDFLLDELMSGRLRIRK